MQERDELKVSADTLRIVTRKEPTPEQMEELLCLADCETCEINAIVDYEEQANLRAGAGQMNRSARPKSL